MANPIHQFEIKPLVPIELGGIDLSYTNSALWMTFGAVISIAFLMMASGKKSLVPGRLQALGEIMYSFIASMVKDNIGVKGKQYFPFIFTLFMFVLMGNVLG
jgi:F-type H+-transporting ATPase subunit a